MDNDAHGKLLNRTFRALQYRNYSLYLTGHGISLLGFWMQQIAMSWLIYRLTNSEFLLGLIAFLGQIPSLLLSPLGGIIADRWSKRKLMILTQSLSMCQATILTILAFTDMLNIWYIMILTIILGFITAFDSPVRQSFLNDTVDKKEDLGNAIALNSTVFNSSRLIGPTLGGLLVAAAGEKVCFLLNAVSYIAVIISLLLIRVNNPAPPVKRNRSIIGDLKEGIRYSYNFKPVRYILMFVAFISLIGMPYMVLMPVFAKQILHGGPNTLGFLMGCTGLGAITGTLYLASRKNIDGLWKIVPFAGTLFGVGLILFSQSHIFIFSAMFLVLTGFGLILQMASNNTLVQTIVDDDKRGRVMSLYVMAFMGIAPLGSLLAGTMATHIGAPNTILISGILCIIASYILSTKVAVFDDHFNGNKIILPEE